MTAERGDEAEAGGVLHREPRRDGPVMPSLPQTGDPQGSPS
jgi:hypothetical protein